MHELARARLGRLAIRACFVERSVKEPDWPVELGQFECVVANQAVHELRHRRHAPELHAQVRRVLGSGGFYLVCDHFAGEGGMSDDQLYVSVAEQQEAWGEPASHTYNRFSSKAGWCCIVRHDPAFAGSCAKCRVARLAAR